MTNLVKGFTKIKEHHVYQFSTVQRSYYIIIVYNKLINCRMLASESILFWGQEGMLLEISGQVAYNDFLSNFARDRGQLHRSIIHRICSCSLLKNGADNRA